MADTGPGIDPAIMPKLFTKIAKKMDMRLVCIYPKELLKPMIVKCGQRIIQTEQAPPSHLPSSWGTDTE